MPYNRLILPYTTQPALERDLDYLWGYQITLCEMMRSVLYAVKSHNHDSVLETHFENIADETGDKLYSTQDSDDNSDQLMAIDFADNMDEIRKVFMRAAWALMTRCESLFLDSRHIDAIVDAYIDDDGLYLLTTRYHKPPISNLM